MNHLIESYLDESREAIRAIEKALSPLERLKYVKRIEVSDSDDEIEIVVMVSHVKYGNTIEKEVVKAVKRFGYDDFDVSRDSMDHGDTMVTVQVYIE